MSESERSANPPGAVAPDGDSFQRHIRDLAATAEEEARRKRHGVKRRDRRFSAIVVVGLVLIAAEATLLVAQMVISRRAVTGSAPAFAARLVDEDDCRGAMYRAYRSVLRFMRDRHRPPATLAELIGRYAERMPADPQTGRPLAYASDGATFSLRCP